MEISEKEQKLIANFKYWIDTNTERGVCYLPDYICAKVLNLIEKLQKENEKYKQFFDLMLRLDSDYFMNCGDEYTNKLVDEILKLESEE